MWVEAGATAASAYSGSGSEADRRDTTQLGHESIRGGVSVALALSIPESEAKPAYLARSVCRATKPSVEPCTMMVNSTTA